MMFRYFIALFDLIHVTANLVFFILVFNSKLNPASAFVYLPLVLLGIWSLFFAIRAWLIKAEKQSLAKNQTRSGAQKAASKLASPVLESLKTG